MDMEISVGLFNILMTKHFLDLKDRCSGFQHMLCMAISQPIGGGLFSDLFLSSCHKKQENQTAIFIKFSVDASNITFSSVVNRTPLSVN